ncbi:hypothetical protein SETIT_7G016600v2 [Setaria italica]|uniref:Uncharacterized protein n=1 Tax=Setaria italica TaxID=4555 RepID=K3YD77_SETIT|nr:hypothetical protein SETIT_7G016600v2 [Setaria italica]
MDLDTGELAMHEFGAGMFGGEPTFVPAVGGASSDQEEDEGHVVVMVQDEAAGASELVVMDACSMEVAATQLVAQRAACREVDRKHHTS